MILHRVSIRGDLSKYGIGGVMGFGSITFPFSLQVDILEKKCRSRRKITEKCLIERNLQNTITQVKFVDCTKGS